MILDLKSIKPIHIVYLAICMIVIGLCLVMTDDKEGLNILTQDSGIAQITVVDLSQPHKKSNNRLYLGMGVIGLGLLLGARNLTIKNPDTNTIADLTPKELEILDLIQKGSTNKDIAQQLHISLSTVKTHINNIYRKSQVSSRAELLSKMQ